MKKLVLVVLALLLCAPWALADLQFSSNGTNVGIATKANIVGATCTRSGQTVTITSTGAGQALTPASVAATGAISAGTGITATTGGVTASAGNVTASAGQVVFQSTVQASGQNTGVTVTISPITPNITSAMLAYGVIQMRGSSAAVAYLGMANGVPGQMVTLQCTVYQGNNIVIGNYGIGITKANFTTITFTGAAQSVTLLWLDNVTGWVVVGNAGTTIA